MLLKKLKFIVFLLIIFAVVGLFWFYNQVNIHPSQDQTQVIFIIEKGEGVNEISEKLFQTKLIKNKFVFETYVWLLDKEGDFIAGSHTVSKNASIRQLTNLLTTEAAPRERNITIIEGWNSKEIAAYLQSENVAAADDFLAYMNKISSDLRKRYDFLSLLPTSTSLEGFLFPDTYRIYSGATIEEIVGKMLDNFERKYSDEMQQETKRQNKSIYEVVTLASIVEKEAAKDEDRQMVADIFLKRLEAGIGLQSDATVNYITGKNMAQPFYTDTRIDNPYNTYKYRGLPPGPISNPSLSSLMAVIYPKSNPYYYFLVSKEGQVFYARTYAEHLANKKKYLGN